MPPRFSAMLRSLDRRPPTEVGPYEWTCELVFHVSRRFHGAKQDRPDAEPKTAGTSALHLVRSRSRTFSVCMTANCSCAFTRARSAFSSRRRSFKQDLQAPRPCRASAPSLAGASAKASSLPKTSSASLADTAPQCVLGRRESAGARIPTHHQRPSHSRTNDFTNTFEDDGKRAAGKELQLGRKSLDMCGVLPRKQFDNLMTPRHEQVRMKNCMFQKNSVFCEDLPRGSTA